MGVERYATELIRSSSALEVLVLMLRHLKKVAGISEVYLVAEATSSADGWNFERLPSTDLWVAIRRQTRNSASHGKIRKAIELAGTWLERADAAGFGLVSEVSLNWLATCLEEATGWACALTEDAGHSSVVAASPRWPPNSSIAAEAAGPSLSWKGIALKVVFASPSGDMMAQRLLAAERIVELWGPGLVDTTPVPSWKMTAIAGSVDDSFNYQASLRTAAMTALNVLGLDAAVVMSRPSEAFGVEVLVGRAGLALARWLSSRVDPGWLHRPGLLQAVELDNGLYTVQIRPLVLGERSLGILALARRQGPLVGRSLEVVRALEGLISLLMLSRLLEEELRKRLTEVDLLWEATSGLVQLKSPEQTLAELAGTWKRLAHADLLAVFLQSGAGELIPKVIHGAPPDTGIGALSATSLEALVRGAMVVSYRRGAGQAYSLPGSLTDLARNYNLALFYLKVDVPVAAVLLARASSPFTGRELRLLAIVFRQVAVALRNAQLFYSVDHERALLRTLFDQASDGVMVVDHRLRVVGFNKAMERITGWKAHELMGRECREFMACRDLGGGLMCANGCPALEAIWNHGQLPYVELKVVDRTGRPKELAVSFSYVPSPSEPDTSYSLAIVRDVTEAKAAERVRTQLVSAVSHELRTPLAALKASVSLLRAALPPELGEGAGPVSRLVENAERSVDRLTRIVEDSLDLARAQAGRLALRREAVDVSELVSNVAASLQPLADHRGQRIACTGTETPTWLVGDRGRLEQVLTNLISNALKYSPEATQVDVAVTVVDGSVRMEIMDRGPGVPPGEQAAIFEPFYRGERALLGSAGSGLGLAVARALVELHGGRISVKNRPGGGAIFTVELPLKAEPKDETVVAPGSDHESAAGR